MTVSSDAGMRVPRPLAYVITAATLVVVSPFVVIGVKRWFGG